MFGRYIEGGGIDWETGEEIVFTQKWIWRDSKKRYYMPLLYTVMYIVVHTAWFEAVILQPVDCYCSLVSPTTTQYKIFSFTTTNWETRLFEIDAHSHAIMGDSDRQ